ncbi:GerAB/ArcD/ProY family transporter [Sporosalibacterium faouarense]|uniref:GerAB/ArcD/ProY family transporter n=1 Tax=Sporosalibacterium faouarense TaxID=516123 RepID=UPI00192BBDB2|nr:endospore germination permease [Sporosalibacterium faouarense]
MNKTVISKKQAIALIILFLTADTFIFAIAASAKKDFWIAILLTFAFISIFSLLFMYIHKLFPDKSLFDINFLLFGRIIGRLINFIFVAFVFFNGLSVLRAFGEFINTIGFPETPMSIPMIFIIILSIWISKDGIEVIGRYGELMLKPIIFLIIISILFLIPKMQIANLQPMFQTDLYSLLKATANTIAFPYGEIITLFAIFSYSSCRNFSKGVYIKGILGATLFILVNSLTIILVGGVTTYTTRYFPSYEVVGRINIGNFLQRLEIIISISFILAGFLKIAICLYVVSRGVSKIVNLNKNNSLVTPLGLLMLSSSLFVYTDITHLFEWGGKYWTIFFLPFEIILPIAVLLTAKVKGIKPSNNLTK